MGALGNLERHADATEANPGIKPFGEAGALTHGAQGLHRFAVEQTEITGSGRERGFTGHGKQFVKPFRKGFPQRAVGGPINALPINDRIALTPFFNKFSNDFRGMLKVSINDDTGLSACMVKACCNRNLLAEVAAERQSAIARIELVEGGDGGAGVIP